MVRGLARFREHFEGYEGSYVLIGGTAVEQYLGALGVASRATKDLDLVLCVELLSPEFLARLKEFLHEGGYKGWFRGEDPGRFYRFERPTADSYPAVIELFSRATDPLDLSSDSASQWGIIPTGEAYESIAALLLEDGYYDYALAHAYEVEGVRVIDAPTLVAFKARAWLDLTERRRRYDEGLSIERVDQKDIDKHRGDILRIATTLSPAQRFEMPMELVQGIRGFVDGALSSGSGPNHMHGLGASMTREEAADLLRMIFVPAESVVD